MRNVSSVGFATLLAAMLVASTTSAADFVCPEAAKVDPPSAQADITAVLPPGVDLSAPDALQSAVFTLLSKGVAPATVLDNVIAAYCPGVAADQSLTDAEKTQRVERFATTATGLVYANNAP